MVIRDRPLCPPLGSRHGRPLPPLPKLSSRSHGSGPGLKTRTVSSNSWRKKRHVCCFASRWQPSFAKQDFEAVRSIVPVVLAGSSSARHGHGSGHGDGLRVPRGGVGARGRGRGTCPWRCRALSRAGGSVPAPQPLDRPRLDFLANLGLHIDFLMGNAGDDAPTLGGPSTPLPPPTISA